MNERLLVVGGTGLTGSAVALAAVDRGWQVRVVVRSGESEPLRRAGIDVQRGDLADRPSLERAMSGVTCVVNAAAVLGGKWATAEPAQMWAVNHDGALRVLEVAADAGVRRCVHLDSNAIWDPSVTLTERSPLMPPSDIDSPYVQAKRAAFAGALHRAMRGQDIVFVTPGAIYGPGMFAERALHPTSFTRTLLRGIRGEIDSFIEYPMKWIFVGDLAEIVLRAIERGLPARRYLALGRIEDVSSLAAFCNEGAALAGSTHRVRSVDPHADDAPDVGSMNQFAHRRYASPIFDDRETAASLGHRATPRAEALATTVAWLRSVASLGR